MPDKYCLQKRPPPHIALRQQSGLLLIRLKMPLFLVTAPIMLRLNLKEYY